MTETLFTALIAAMLLIIPCNGGMSPARCLVTGILFGLAALCRPTIWPWGCVMGAAALAGSWLNRSPADGWWKQGAVRATTLVAGCCLVVGPWLARNVAVLGAPIMTTTHGGYTLLLANNPVVYRQEVFQPWGTTWEEAPPGQRQSDWYAEVQAQVRSELGDHPTEMAVDRWMTERAWTFIRQHPAPFVRACLFRIARLWNVAPLGAAAAAQPRTLVIGATAFYLAVWGLALVGMARWTWCERSRRGDADLTSPPRAALFRSLTTEEGRGVVGLAALLFTFTAVHAVYWSNARMRTPLMPAVAIIAACGATGAKRSFGVNPSTDSQRRS